MTNLVVHNPAEWTGNLRVEHPVKDSGSDWWAPHLRDCDVFRAPRADCDCGAQETM